MRTASELVPYFSRLLDDEPELPLDDEDDELLEEEEDDEPLTASAILASVYAPAMPSAERPFLRWKFMTAASVMLP